MAHSRLPQQVTAGVDHPPRGPTGDATGSPDAARPLQRAIGNRAFAQLVRERRLARKEVAGPAEFRGAQDWSWVDRAYRTQRWKDACLFNLNRADSSQYERIPERRDFYWWFYEYTAARGWETKWPLAAAIVANGAYQIAYMDTEHDWANETLDLASVELQGTMRRGNQVIFDNVLPKLKKLVDGGPLRGHAALEWDMRVLGEEQTLAQPLYDQMSSGAFAELDYIARKKRFAGLGAEWTGEENVAAGPYNSSGIVPGFSEANLKTAYDRWLYGMKLGGAFVRHMPIRPESDPYGRSWFNPRADSMSVGGDYLTGKEFAKVDTHAGLHYLDAWLNPHRISRRGAGSDIKAIVAMLTDSEKRRVLTDSSVDGWAYSVQFAQFLSIDENLVRSALPSTPDAAAAVTAFMARFRRERSRAQAVLDSIDID
jgi:hypothetical protein